MGDGLAAAIAAGVVRREDVFVQTKFTPIPGQDPQRLPYDPQAPLEAQVRQSVAASLRNLKTPYIDSLVLHFTISPHDDMMAAWRTIEEFVRAGQVKQLSISNFYDTRTFDALWDDAVVKPAVLQNRFYKDTAYDVDLRARCRERGIAYQPFWMLTANPHVIQSPAHAEIAARRGLTGPQLFYRFLMDIGCVPLSGTTNAQHMNEDVAVVTAPPLGPGEVSTILGLLPAPA